jgi:hypothetical protein
MKAIIMTCYVFMSLIFLYLEAMLIINNPWNFINPFLQFFVIIQFFTVPAVWILLPITIVALLIGMRKQ